MAYKDPQAVHEDKYLTQISVAYDQEDPYIGDRIFPAVPVRFQSDKYRVFNKDNAARVTDDHRSPGARANEIPPMMLPSKDTYFATDHKLKDVVPIEESENFDPDMQLDDSDPYVAGTQRLTDTILLNREYALLQMILTTANYAAGHTVTLSGTAQWSDLTNSVPIADIKTGRKKIHDVMGPGRDANLAIIGDEIWWTLEDHPKITDKFGTADLKMTTADVILRVLRLDDPGSKPGNANRVTVLRAVAEYNTAAYGQPANMVDLWGKHILLAHVPSRPGKRTPAFGYEFVWPYRSGGEMKTDRWWDEDREADMIRVGRRYDQKFISVNGSGLAIGGYLIKNVVA